MDFKESALRGGRKCNQTLSNDTKFSLFHFCTFLCLVHLKICVSLNGAKPFLEFSIKPNRYILRPFQRAILGFSNLWIHLSFKEFYWLSMPKIPYPPFQMGSWAMCLGGRIFLLQQRKLYLLFSVFFQTYFGIV